MTAEAGAGPPEAKAVSAWWLREAGGGSVGVVVGLVGVRLSRLTLPESAVVKVSATVLAPLASGTGSSRTAQVSQFAVAGRDTWRTLTPLT